MIINSLMKLEGVRRIHVAFCDEDRGRHKCHLCSPILIILLLSSLFALALSAQSLGEQEIIERMASAAEAIRTVQCDFTQTKRLKMLKKEQVSQGRMFCQQPDKLRWEYTSPKAKTISYSSSKGGGVEGSMARLIMNSVAGKSLTDRKTFQVTAKETATEYVATLVPQRKDMKRLYTKLVLHFDTRQSTVTKVELHEKNGDQTIIDLHDIRINE